MTITYLGQNVQSGYASGSGTGTLTWIPPSPTDGDLHVLFAGAWGPLRGSAPTISDLAGWTPAFNTFYDGYPSIGGQWRRIRAWIRRYAPGDPDPTLTGSGMNPSGAWGGELVGLRGPTGGLVSVTPSYRSATGAGTWSATDPGSSGSQMNVLIRHSNGTSTRPWVPDASWDGGHQRDTDAGIHFAYREGPASAGTVSFSASGPEYCHVLTIDMTASRNGWVVGRLAW